MGGGTVLRAGGRGRIQRKQDRGWNKAAAGRERPRLVQGAGAAASARVHRTSLGPSLTAGGRSRGAGAGRRQRCKRRRRCRASRSCHRHTCMRATAAHHCGWPPRQPLRRGQGCPTGQPVAARGAVRCCRVEPRGAPRPGWRARRLGSFPGQQPRLMYSRREHLSPAPSARLTNRRRASAAWRPIAACAFAASCSLSVVWCALSGEDQGGVRLSARERSASWGMGTGPRQAPSNAMVLWRPSGPTLSTSMLWITSPSGVPSLALAGSTVAPAANSTLTIYHRVTRPGRLIMTERRVTNLVANVHGGCGCQQRYRP